MREKEIAKSISKLIVEWGDSILNDELLFRVMLDDSLTDAEKKIFHCLDSTTMGKIYQAFENARQNGKINLNEVEVCLDEKKDISEQWTHNLIVIFRTAIAEALQISNYDEKFSNTRSKVIKMEEGVAEKHRGQTLEEISNDFTHEDEAFEQKKAKEGDASAQYELGKKYYIEEKYGQAVFWLQKYLESVSNVWIFGKSCRDDVYFLLGDCYYYGRGVTKDDEKAFDYWIKSRSEEAIDRLERCFPIKYHEFQENMTKSLKSLDDLFSD